jgi:hypothetical protein
LARRIGGRELEKVHDVDEVDRSSGAVPGDRLCVATSEKGREEYGCVGAHQIRQGQAKTKCSHRHRHPIYHDVFGYPFLGPIAKQPPPVNADF